MPLFNVAAVVVDTIEAPTAELAQHHLEQRLTNAGFDVHDDAELTNPGGLLAPFQCGPTPTLGTVTDNHPCLGDLTST